MTGKFCWSLLHGKDIVAPVHKHYIMMVYGGVKVKFHTFLTLVLDEGEWSVLCSGCFISSDRNHGNH
jgi:hypothetical protein